MAETDPKTVQDLTSVVRDAPLGPRSRSRRTEAPFGSREAPGPRRPGLQRLRRRRPPPGPACPPPSPTRLTGAAAPAPRTPSAPRPPQHPEASAKDLVNRRYSRGGRGSRQPVGVMGRAREPKPGGGGGSGGQRPPKASELRKAPGGTGPRSPPRPQAGVPGCARGGLSSCSSGADTPATDAR